MLTTGKKEYSIIGLASRTTARYGDVFIAVMLWQTRQRNININNNSIRNSKMPKEVLKE